MTLDESALVIGAGPGLGLAVARRLAQSGRRVAIASRTLENVARLAAAEPSLGMRPIACDVTDPRSVTEAFGRVDAEVGPPSVVVFNAGGFARGSILDLDPAAFEHAWRVGCYGGMLVGQQAARRMVAAGKGAILFTGATASMRGSAQFSAFAASKFGLRALAQSMARELGPRNVHVAHVVIDGGIGPADGADPALLSPDAIAATYMHLVEQPRSCWSFEVDVRTSVEKW